MIPRSDSIYRLFEAKSLKRFESGEANILEKTAAQSHRQQITNQLNMLEKDLAIVNKQFNLYLQDSMMYVPDLAQSKVAQSLIDDSGVTDDFPAAALARHAEEAARSRWRVERARLLPDLTIGYNNQSLQGVQNVNGQDVLFSGRDRFNYFSAGVSIPLFFKAQSSKVAAAKLQW